MFRSETGSTRSIIMILPNTLSSLLWAVLLLHLEIILENSTVRLCWKKYPAFRVIPPSNAPAALADRIQLSFLVF
jgi:hypothetical protein